MEDMYKVFGVLVALVISSSVLAQEAPVCSPGRGFIELEYALMMQDYASASANLPPMAQVDRQTRLLSRLKDRVVALWRQREGGTLSNEAYLARMDEFLSNPDGAIMNAGSFERVAVSTFVADTTFPLRVEELIQLLPGGDLIRFCVYQVSGAEMLSCTVLNLATGHLHGTDPLGSQILAQTGPDLDGSSGVGPDSSIQGVETAVRYRALLGAAISMGRSEYVRRRLAGEFGTVCDPINQIEVQLAQEDDADWRRLFPGSPAATVTSTGGSPAAVAN